jgi:AraC-like DNA-binding protein
MSQKFFEKELHIDLLPCATPIRFVHKYSFERPEGFRLHLNDYLELYIFAKGKVDYIVGNDCFALTCGDVLAISPHEVHVPVLRHPCEYERFYLLIPLDSFKGYRTDPLCTLSAQGRAKIPLSEADKTHVLRLLGEISALCEGKSTDGVKLTSLGLLHQLLGILTAADTRSEEKIPPPSGVPQLVREVLQYINRAPQEPHAVSDIAARFHISPPYLSSLFKRHVGVTVSSYLRVQRIALAKRLLEQGHPVSFVCFECGFSDSSHFIKHFKQYVGVTPHVYQRGIAKEKDDG